MRSFVRLRRFVCFKIIVFVLLIRIELYFKLYFELAAAPSARQGSCKPFWPIYSGRHLQPTIKKKGHIGKTKFSVAKNTKK